MKSIKKCLPLIFLLYWACKSDNIEEHLEFNEIIPAYSLNLDKTTGNYVLASQYLENWNGQESFAILNRNMNEIKIYGLVNGDAIDSILYDVEGPTGVGRIYDFFIHNKDSIFLNEKYSYNIHLVDYFGIPKNTYRIVPEDAKFNKGGVPEGNRTALAEFSIFSPGYVIGNYLYVNTRPDGDLMNPSYYDSKELGLKIDLTTGEYSYLMSYPESHKNNIWGVGYSTTFRNYNSDDNIFVYSFPIDGSIYTTTDHKSFKNYEFNSRYFDKTKPLSKPTRDPAIYTKYGYTNDSYSQILYDKNQHLYYRLGEYKIDDDLYVSPTGPLSNLLDIAVVVHNSDFERLGEYKINQVKNRAVIPLKSFINSSGLCIAYIDFENEDKLHFINLKISYK